MNWRMVITPDSFNHTIGSILEGDDWLQAHQIPSNQCDRVVVLPWLRLVFFRMQELDVNNQPKLNADMNDIERTWWMRWLRVTPPMVICEA